MSERGECPVCGESLCKHGSCTDNCTPWKDGCPNANCQDCAEAAFERRLNDYYGSSIPQTEYEDIRQ
jgi:hypothetical protein